ncbi:MAG: hypothetical protein WD845_08015 [Pirellulales bacterium]
MSVAAIVVAIHMTAATSVADAAFLAQAGFNDASGINSDSAPNSPYILGAPILGSGGGESGWTGTWFGGGTVQTATVLEGDGALRIDPVTSSNRNFAAQPSRLEIEQYVRFAAGARLVVYTLGSNSEDPGNHGAIWQAFPNGNFNVIDGIGDGGSPTPIATGFTWTPNTWYKVNLDIDLLNHVWDFYVDDVKYIPENPLGYRGNPAALNQIRFQSEGSGPVFLDALTIVPEPSMAMLASIGMLTFLALLGTRQMTNRRKKGVRNLFRDPKHCRAQSAARN